MKLITRDTDYAIRALIYIARNNRRIVSIPELVKRLKIPGPFLRKILQILNKKGVLESHKGKGGGFILSAPAEKVFIVDLIKIFQGSLSLNECLFRKTICPNIRICKFRKRIKKIEKYVISELKSINLAKL